MHTTPPWPPAFDAAIFDFDGTIANTGWIWEEVDRAFLGARGIPYTTEYARILTVLGFSSGAQYTIETYHLDEDPADICEEWTRLSSALYRTKVTLRPGVEEYIKKLRSLGIKTALATSNEPKLISSMEHVDVEALFDVRVHARDVGTTKDEPDIYLEAARRLGVDPTRCMVFEDIEPGLRVAREAGFITCAVKSDETAQLLEDVHDAAEFFLEDWTALIPDDEEVRLG
ncbi:MAG: HAD family phosphatase [Atopobiaceae bacterium]|nr:HAD family phosphatase [Atopobiaceae bacterium]